MLLVQFGICSKSLKRGRVVLAGYIMSLGGSNLKTEEQIKKLVHDVFTSGVYSPHMNIPQKNEWNGVQEGTVADFLSMREGDHIYFFCKRKAYGIGKLIKIEEIVFT